MQSFRCNVKTTQNTPGRDAIRQLVSPAVRYWVGEMDWESRGASAHRSKLLLARYRTAMAYW